MTPQPEIVVTDIDLVRLRACIDSFGVGRTAAAAEALEVELERARVVASRSVPANVVTMNSRVVFIDEETYEAKVCFVVYPDDADPDEGHISVLAPIGAALLGLSVGQSIEWTLPSGRQTRLRLVDILYQPEAEGDFHL